MPISSYNKSNKDVRIKITKQEIRAWSPVAGINILQYPPEQKFTQIIRHPDGLTSKVKNRSSGIGEMNLHFSASGVHFDPTQRRYPEDIEKAMEDLNIITTKVTEKEEPNHILLGKGKEMGLDNMEHQTFFDNPTLDVIDKVRSIMEQNKTKETRVFNQLELKNLETMMTRRAMIYGSAANRQADPNRFFKIRNQGARNMVTGLKEYDVEVGAY